MITLWPWIRPFSGVRESCIHPRIEAARAAAFEIVDVARGDGKVMGETGGGDQAVNHGQRFATRLCFTSEPSPGRSDRRVDRKQTRVA